MSRYSYINYIAALVFATLLSVGASAQNYGSDIQQRSGTNKANDDEEEKYTPKITVLKDQGLALGVDLAPVIMRFIQGENTGFAFMGRYGFKTKWWGNAEIGYTNTKYSNQNYDYESNGTYIKIGLDYDIFQSEYFPVNDNIFVGARYGYAWQKHKSDNFTIVDSYWGDYKGSVAKSSVNSHMFEVVFGLRCEVLKNFYMGWSVRGKFLIASFHENDLNPYAIAGFGNNSARAGIGFTYTVEYQIPFNKLGKNRRNNTPKATTIEISTNPKEEKGANNGNE